MKTIYNGLNANKACLNLWNEKDGKLKVIFLTINPIRIGLIKERKGFNAHQLEFGQKPNYRFNVLEEPITIRKEYKLSSIQTSGAKLYKFLKDLIKDAPKYLVKQERKQMKTNKTNVIFLTSPLEVVYNETLGKVVVIETIYVGKNLIIEG